MKQELNEIERILLQKNYKSYSTLQVGINEAYIVETLKSNNLSFELPLEIFDLYKWHNGQSGLYSIEINKLKIFKRDLFYPFEEAIGIYIHQKKYFGDNNFPLFGIVDTRHLVIDLSKDSSDYLSIRYYDPYEEHPIKIYPSLKSMIQANLDCYKSGAYYPDENGLLYINKNLQTNIHKNYGNGCEYWNSVS